MHKKSRISKAIAASLMAVTMVAPSVAAAVPMSASADIQVLGESDFTNKALPWHTCESSPAKQDFAIEKGEFHIKVLVPDGAEGAKWDLQFRHRNLNFKKGHTYKVSFKVKAKRAGMELCSKIGNIKGDEEYFDLMADGTMKMGPKMGGEWGAPLKLTTDWTTVTGTFEPTFDVEGVEWAFHYANATKNNYGGNAQEGDELWFDEMSIICTTCGDTYKEGSCGSDPDKSYGATNRTYGAMAVDKDKYMPGGKINNYISVNQIGYYSNLKKVATLSDNAGDILPNKQTISLSGTYTFNVCDASTGKVVYTGTSGAVKADKDSNDNVCKLDFSEFKTPGRYYLEIDGKGWRSYDFNIGDNIYSDDSHDMLTNACNYFYQNRSGIDIEGSYITSGDKKTLAHQGGHKTDTATIQKKWLNQYGEGDVAANSCGTLTANGGWYDAGDHGKYVVNGGIAVWTLQNMYERAAQTEAGKKKFADGSGTVVVPETGDGVPDILNEAAVELDWMTQMKVTSADTAWGKYEGMVYHKLHDHKWTGLATKPWDYEKEWGTERIVKPPTLAATLNYAACAGQAARLWEPYDSKKAAFYLEEAKAAFKAYEKNWVAYDSTETTHPELGCKCPKEELNETSLYAPMWHAKGGGPYGDDNVLDDAYWAACEIYLSATAMGDSDASYYKGVMDKSDYAYTCNTRMVGGENKDGSFTSFNWGNTASAGTLSLALHKDLLSDSENSKVKSSILEAADAYIEEEGVQGYGIPYKYDGKGYNDPNNLDPSIMIYGYEWGSNSMVINNAIVMAYAYDLTNGDVNYMNGVTTAMDYLLGNNPLAFSFVTGYGTYHEKNPHHRYWSYELDKELPMAPDGVLSGGPNSGLQDPYVRALGFVPGKKDNPSQRCFVDSIEAWSTNEVTINWNAPLAWIASFLQDEAADAGSKTPDPTTEPTTKPTQGGSDVKVTLWGDANCDKKVSIADSTAILMHLGNESKYGLSEQGAANADVVANGGGVTPMDAIAIQAVDAKLLQQTQFPITEAEYEAAIG